MSFFPSCRAFVVFGSILVSAAAFSADREVTTDLDNVAGLLRTVIAAADPGERIVFAPGVIGPINYSAAAEIMIDEDLTIDASTVPGGITVSARPLRC